MAPEANKPERGPAAGKPRYETPVVLPLGEMAKAHGGTCSQGSAPSGQGGGNCSTGRLVGGFCATGSLAGGQCNTGGGR